MHATRDTTDAIKLRDVCGRVMRGVRCGNFTRLFSPGKNYMSMAKTLACSFCLIVLAASATLAAPKEVLQLDAFGDVSWGNMKTRLDWYAVELNNQPGAHAYILLYGGRVSVRGEMRERIACMKDYLVKHRKVSGERLKFIQAGYREEFSGEMWIIPEGHQAPAASPTVGRNEVKILKRSANRWRVSCSVR